MTLEGKNKDETKDKALNRMHNNGGRKRVRDRDGERDTKLDKNGSRKRSRGR